jgi:hypothetical protein
MLSKKKKKTGDDRAKKIWRPSNRNLLHLPEAQRWRQLLATGPVSVRNFLAELPPTKHSLSELRVDSSVFQQLSTLSVVMHGSLRDKKLDLDLSFDRTFLLLPAPEGSP